MQNSIWKLTALAGVIGIGFLIALQTQYGLNAEHGVAQFETQSPPEDTAQPEVAGSTNTAMGLFQSEPTFGPSDAPSRASSPQRNVQLASNVAPHRRSTADREPPAFVPERRPTRALPEFTDRETTRPAFFEEPEDAADIEVPSETPKARMLRLMAEARDAKESGQLATARALLLEAIDLPVVFEALDDRPTVMLAEIDAILKARDRATAAEATSQKKAPAVARLPLLAESATEELPRLDSEVPVLKDDLPDAPFAGTLDTEPTPIAAPPKRLVPLPDADSERAPRPLQRLNDDENPFGPADSLIDAKPAERSTDTESEFAPPAKAVAKKKSQQDLSIEKVAPENAKLGQPMIYSLFIENRGSVAATSVVVEDTIPKSCDLVGTVPQAEMVGQKLTWRIGRLEVGQKKKILVKMVPNEVGDIGTDARASSIPETADAAPPTKRPSSSKLRLNVSGPERVKLGDNAILKFKLVNASSETVNEVTLQNIIPAGFRHTDGNDLTYPIGKLESGQSLEVELTLKAVKPGEQTNRTIVTASGGLQTEAATSVEVIDNRPLRVETKEAATMPIGQPTVQETRIINESAKDVAGVSIIELLPEGLRFVKASHNGQFDPVARKVNWSLDRIPAGETAVLKLTLLPKTLGPHACVIEVNQAEQPEPGRFGARVKARGVSALAIELNHDEGTVMTGDEFPVAVRLRNRGNGPDFNVARLLRLPPELEFVHARGPVKHRSDEATSGTGSVVSFIAMPEFGEKTSVDFEIRLRAKLPGKAKLRAEVVSDEVPDPIGSETFVVVLDGSP